MDDFQESLVSEYSSRALDQRTQWYSPTAEAYQRVRPRYPGAIINQVVDLAHLSPQSRILEVGCGPAIATLPFAALGCSMVCVEPNPDFYGLAQQTCQGYPNVNLENCSFEEWNLEAQPSPKKFDAVLAATSFHWVDPAIGYAKAAAALKPEGFLIFLWNAELQPSHELYQQLDTVYQRHQPYLNRSYKDPDTQLSELASLGDMMVQSGLFQTPVTGHAIVDALYSVDQYLQLLTTYSPFLKLEPQRREQVLEELRQVLPQDNDFKLPLSFVSAFQVAQLR